jgi:hypothetical protein
MMRRGQLKCETTQPPLSKSTKPLTALGGAGVAAGVRQTCGDEGKRHQPDAGSAGGVGWGEMEGGT